jgi:hypothetical protein
MTHLAGRVAAAFVLALTIGVTTGCAPSIDTLVRDSLADAVEGGQDVLWEYRDQIVSDPEAAIAGLDFIGDARVGADDGNHSYTLLALDESEDSVTLTLAVDGGAETGGGLWYQQSNAVTCIDLVFPTAAAEIRVEGAACGDDADVAGYEQVVPFGDLQVREVVTVADYPPPVCQCHSGGDCDCPGG